MDNENVYGKVPNSTPGAIHELRTIKSKIRELEYRRYQLVLYLYHECNVDTLALADVSDLPISRVKKMVRYPDIVF
jgi:hypothetical protein